MKMFRLNFLEPFFLSSLRFLLIMLAYDISMNEFSVGSYLTCGKI